MRVAGARDVVFFMHGVFDTSMGWVSNGVTGSQAFAAYDQGFDVWLGNSRANPPRSHVGAPLADPISEGSHILRAACSLPTKLLRELLQRWHAGSAKHLL